MVEIIEQESIPIVHRKRFQCDCLRDVMDRLDVKNLLCLDKIAQWLGDHMPFYREMKVIDKSPIGNSNMIQQNFFHVSSIGHASR